MDTIYLQELSVDDSLDAYEMLQRIGPYEFAFVNEVNGMSIEEYREWLIKMNSWGKGEMLPEGYVRQWIYWLMEDGKPIGIGKLREKVTEASRKHGGNIGYAIDPLVRGKGYGKILFEKLIEEASVLGIKEIYSTVQKGNDRSKIIHEKCGGILVKDDGERWHFSFELNV